VRWQKKGNVAQRERRQQREGEHDRDKSFKELRQLDMVGADNAGKKQEEWGMKETG
jgi:hypothetical protein